MALATPEDWYVGSIDPTDIFHKTTRVLKELAATGKSKKVAADSLKSLREFWDKASKQFKDKFVFYSPSITTATDFSIVSPQDVFIYIKGGQ